MKKIIFIFPGQGSQHKNMLLNLYNNFSIIRNTIKYGSNIINYHILRIINNINKLNDTVYSQPIIFIISVALWRLWNQKNGIRTTISLGHSLGEYTALVCNNILSFKKMIILIMKRAKLMKYISKKNNLLMISSINLNFKNINNLYLYIKKKYYIEIGNINSKQQLIISLKKTDKNIIKNILKIHKTRCITLKMNTISHCKALYGILKIFKQALNIIKYRELKSKIIHNLTINHCNNINRLKKILIYHLHNKVIWLENIKYINYINNSMIIECGPSEVFKKLINQMTKISCKTINNYDKFKKNIFKE